MAWCGTQEKQDHEKRIRADIPVSNIILSRDELDALLIYLSHQSLFDIVYDVGTMFDCKYLFWSGDGVDEEYSLILSLFFTYDKLLLIRKKFEAIFDLLGVMAFFLLSHFMACVTD